jgi:NACHT domain- and WD repeat-containing protein
MKDDQTAWWNILSRLQKMLRNAVTKLYESGKISREEMHNYFMSGTELIPSQKKSSTISTQ